ncbi:Glycine cleavage system transcriptional activator [compost metagenome]
MTVAFDNIENTAASLRPVVEESAVVKLRTSVAASNWLLPALSEFYSSNPDILLQMICIDDSASIDIADYDIEVRFGSGNWSDGISYPLLDEVIFPVASPEFLRLHPIERIEDLCAVPLLQLANHISPLMSWTNWLPNQELDKPAQTFIRSYSTYSTLLDAAVYGHGVALGWKYYAAEALVRGDLCPVLPLRKTSRLKEFLVVNRQRAQDSKVARTTAWIRAYAEATRIRFKDV